MLPDWRIVGSACLNLCALSCTSLSIVHGTIFEQTAKPYIPDEGGDPIVVAMF